MHGGIDAIGQSLFFPNTFHQAAAEKSPQYMIEHYTIVHAADKGQTTNEVRQYRENLIKDYRFQLELYKTIDQETINNQQNPT